MPWNGYREPTKKQIQDQTFVYATDGGGTDAYAITISGITVYTTGMRISFKANTANIGAATLNINSLGDKTIKKLHDQDLADNDIEAGQIVDVEYDGTYWQMQSSRAQILTDDINLNYLTSPTPDYKTVQDWVDTIQSAGRISGGTLTDNENGTIAVTAGSGFVKVIADDELSNTLFFNWEEDTSVSLTDNSTNKIYVDYNSGTPIVSATTGTINNNTQILLGLVYREGNVAHIINGGTTIYNFARRVHARLREKYEVERLSGMITTEKDVRYLNITAGVLYNGINRLLTSAFDSSGTDKFNYYYRDGIGGWTKVINQTQINNTQYDDGDGTLGTLTANRYGVHWVYMHNDSHVDVVYGQGDYTISQAEDASPSANLPDIITNFATIIAKIIIKKDSNTFPAFTSVETPFEQAFTKSLVDDHNDMGGIQGGTADDYFHLKEAQLKLLHNYAADAESSDDYVVTLDPAPASYTIGMIASFKANTTNTGIATLNVNGLGAKTIKKLHDQDLTDGDIESGQIVIVSYDGTNFQMQSQPAQLVADTIADANVVFTDITTGNVSTTKHGFCPKAPNDVNQLLSGLGTFKLYEACSVYKTGVQSISNNVFTAVTFDNTRFDVNNMHSEITNNTRITVSQTGIYLIIGGGYWVANATGTRQTVIKVNNSYYLGQVAVPVNSASDFTMLTSARICALNANDYVELFVLQNSGGNLNFGGSDTNISFFSAARII